MSYVEPPVHELPKGRVLLVDDESGVLRAHERVLLRAGYEVVCAHDGAEAVDELRSRPADVVVTDIAMPGMDGLEVLKSVRRKDVDLPVILLTARPTLESAILGIQHGAFRYLLKPVEPNALVQVVRQASRLYAWANVRRQAVAELGHAATPVNDRAGLHASLSRALDSMWMAYQPIVAWPQRRIVGYEALLRTEDTALPLPEAILAAAERLGRLEDVGRATRAKIAQTLAATPETTEFYVNLHVRDLLDDQLFSASCPLARHASRVVLEVTERAALDDVPDIHSRIGALRDRGYRIAVDDLGAGYAGLTSFAHLEPDVVKIDMSLVRNVNREPIKQKLIRSICTLGKELQLGVIAEGVETEAERNTLADAGCELYQGYLFARPTRQLATSVTG